MMHKSSKNFGDSLCFGRLCLKILLHKALNSALSQQIVQLKKENFNVSNVFGVSSFVENHLSNARYCSWMTGK